MIDWKNEVNTIHHAYITKLNLYTEKFDFCILKFDKSHLHSFEIVLVDFPVKNMLERV